MPQDSECRSLEDLKKQVEKRDDQNNRRFEMIETKQETRHIEIMSRISGLDTKVAIVTNTLDGIRNVIDEQKKEISESLQIASSLEKNEKTEENEKKDTVSNFVVDIFKDAIKTVIVAIFVGVIVLVVLQTNIFPK